MPASKQKRAKKTEKYKSFKLQKKVKPKTKPVIGPYRLLRRSLSFMLANKKILASLSLVFAALYMLLVRGVGSVVNVDSLLDRADLTSVSKSLNIFSDVVSGTGPRSGAAGVFQVVLFVIFSLGLLYIIRSVKSDVKNLKTREVYYFGTGQFVPYFVVLVFCLLMLVPMGLGSAIIETARQNNLIISNIEQAGFLVFAFSLALVSMFLLAGALFSLIIVSLGKIKPGESIAIGWRLVKHRRGTAVYRLVALLCYIVAIIVVTVLPVVFIYAQASEYVFYAVSIFILVLAHVYIYELYSEMIKK